MAAASGEQRPIDNVRRIEPRAEDGVAMLTSMVILAVLAIVGGLVIYFSSSSARTAERAASKSEAAGLAEAGLAEAMAVISNPSTNRADGNLLPVRTSTYATGSAIWSGTYDAVNSVWTLTAKGKVKNPSATDDVQKGVTAKVWTSEIVYTHTPNGGERDIWIMNLDGSGARPVADNSFEDGDAFWSPDTGTFTYESEEDTDAAASAGKSNATPAGPPTTNREIYTMRIDGSGKTRLTDQDGTPSWQYSSIDEDPQWGPNGKIVFDTMRNGHANSPASGDGNNHYLNNFDIYIMDSDGTDQTNITPCVPDNPATSAIDESNYWVTSSDHTRCSRDEEPAYGPGAVCIQSTRGGTSDLFKIPLTVNTDGSVTAGAASQLTTSGDIEAECDWSQDGTKIAYMRWNSSDSVGTTKDIYVMNADGSDQTRITNNSVEDEHPGWTADGRIVFNSRRTSGAVNINNADGSEEIFIMNADGTNVHQLTFTTGATTENRFPDVRSRFSLYNYSG